MIIEALIEYHVLSGLYRFNGLDIKIVKKIV